VRGGNPGLVCSTLALAVPAAAAECREYKMEHQDPNTLKLKDGEHVIASVDTVAGKLEARVSVKGKDVSDPRLFLGGKRLKDITESRIPKEVRECLPKKTGALPSGSWIADAARSILDWIVPPAYAARLCLRWIYSSTCSRDLDGKWYCVVSACCVTTGGTFCGLGSN